MKIRGRLLQGATALLYLGPLCAGLAGFGWAMLAPFVSVFLLWLIALRPQQWPQSGAEWLRADCLIQVLTQLVTQILLVAVLFGIGRGIGGVTGHLPVFHPMAPVTLSIIGLTLAQLCWNAGGKDKGGLTVDDVMYPQDPPPPAAPAPAPGVDMLSPLLALADDAPLVKVGPALEEFLDEDAAGDEVWSRLSALADALDAAPGRHAALREALLIWATDPEVFAANAAPLAMKAAFRAAGQDTRLLGQLLPRAAALARIMPEQQTRFPDPARLEELARLGLPAQPAADLAALMATLGKAVAPAAERPRRTPPPPVGAKAGAGAT